MGTNGRGDGNGELNQVGNEHHMPEIEEPMAKKMKGLRCAICSEEHFTNNCPLLHGPKPYATFCGLAGDGLGFFHVPTEGVKLAPPPERVTSSALIRIVQVEEHKDKEFIVPFPSKVELDRLVAIKSIPTDQNEGVLQFEEWNNEIKPKKRLHRVWVKVYGVPHEIHSFLPLWSIGSTLGATVKVDMAYLRQHGIVRLLVDVLDSNDIPDETDIVTKGCMYSIFFKIDEVVSYGENLDEDDLLGDEEAQGEDQDMHDVEQDHTVTNGEKVNETPNIQKQGESSTGMNKQQVSKVSNTVAAAGSQLPACGVSPSASVLSESALSYLHDTALTMVNSTQLQPFHQKETPECLTPAFTAEDVALPTATDVAAAKKFLDAASPTAPYVECVSQHKAALEAVPQLEAPEGVSQLAAMAVPQLAARDGPLTS